MAERKVKKALITAAGRGTRFLPAVKAVPKEMLPVGDKPIIQHLAEECVNAGIEDIIIVIRPGSESIVSHFSQDEGLENYLKVNGKEDKLKKVEVIHEMARFIFIYQDPKLPYGNGSPVLTAKSLLSDGPFAMLWGDDLVYTEGDSAMKQLVDFYASTDADAVIGVQEVKEDEVVKYGIVKIKEGTENEVQTIIEKPSVEEAPSRFASYGRQVLSPKVFDYLTAESTGKDGELWLQDANDKVAQNGKTLLKAINGEWVTTGDPVNYMKAQMKFSLANPEWGGKLKDELSKSYSGGF